MEFFPSTGADQWELILESITAADFCLFVVAGKYGSVVPNLGISWTQREYREAVQQGKPIIILLHRDIGQLPALNVEIDEIRRAALESFRVEWQAAHGCRYFLGDAELLNGLNGSVAALKRSGRIQGWMPAGPRPVPLQETDFDRTYELVETDHVFRRSELIPDRLDMSYSARRQVRGNVPEGVARIAQDFTRDSESELMFDESNTPRVALSTYSIRKPRDSVS
jgi:hypothetical protein